MGFRNKCWIRLGQYELLAHVEAVTEPSLNPTQKQSIS